MIVVSDNSPLSALPEIGHLEVLANLYGRIVVPSSVAREAAHPNAPSALQRWIANPPAWVDIVPDPSPLLPEVAELGAGEAAAITFAWHAGNSALLLVDDLPARRISTSLSIIITGTAGVLLEAAREGLLDFHSAISRLQKTTFRLSPAIIEELEAKLNAP